MDQDKEESKDEGSVSLESIAGQAGAIFKPLRMEQRKGQKKAV